jgi:hypothetical protein
MDPSRPFCADISRQNAEPLTATASRVDNWILVEYRGLWGHDAVGSSGLSDTVKVHLRDRARTLPLTKLLFVRRTERRRQEGLLVYWGSTPEQGGCLYRAEIERYDDLLTLDLVGPGDPVDHPLLLVCTHGKHDPCCARYGRPLYSALSEEAEAGWVWQVTHIGGDRFAGNLVCLPEGLYYGHVGASDAWPLLEDYLAGRIRLDHYRGRSCYPFAVQAAERRIREEAGLAAIADLRLLTAERAGAAWRVRFASPSGEVEVEVEPELGELAYLTCSDETLRRPRRFAARSLRESAA